MSDSFTMRAIAHIRNDFTEKFGIPRQSGLAANVLSAIIFEPEYRCADALRGLEEFSHLWLIWRFSDNPEDDTFRPTVRPPKLGGNRRMGVFATRSPFRPNPVGLSSVKIIKIERTREFGDIIIVSGADLMNETPIYDIKPYLPYTDSHSDAKSGFAPAFDEGLLSVEIPSDIEKRLPFEKISAIREILSQDPRPAYQEDEARIYKFSFGGMEIAFRVFDGTAYVVNILWNKSI